MVAEPGDEHDGHIAGLAAALVRQGHQVTVYRRREERRSPRPKTTAEGFRVVRVPAVDEVGDLVRALEAEWADAPPEVVHTHSRTTALAAGAVAARRGIPVVHSFPHLGATPSRGTETEHVLVRAAARFTVTCSAHVNVLVSRGVPRSRISVVPHGADMDLFTPDGDREPAVMRHRLVAVGEPTPQSGFTTAIAALCGLPETELVIAGTPVDALRRYADDLGVADRLRFTGRLSPKRLPTLLRSADVMVCTPWHEPFECAAVEAMACGVTVVASTVGSLTDIVIDKVTGILVPPRRPRVLADRLHRLLTQPVTREQYGATSRDRVCARYSWHRIATETVNAYHRAGVTTPDGPRKAATPAARRIGATR